MNKVDNTTIDEYWGNNRKKWALLRLTYEGKVITEGCIANENLRRYREIISSEEIDFEYYQKMKQLAYILRLYQSGKGLSDGQFLFLAKANVWEIDIANKINVILYKWEEKKKTTKSSKLRLSSLQKENKLIVDSGEDAVCIASNIHQRKLILKKLEDISNFI